MTDHKFVSGKFSLTRDLTMFLKSAEVFYINPVKPFLLFRHISVTQRLVV